MYVYNRNREEEEERVERGISTKGNITGTFI